MVIGATVIFGLLVMWFIYRKWVKLAKQAIGTYEKAKVCGEFAKADLEVAALFRRDAIKMYKEAKRIHEG